MSATTTMNQSEKININTNYTNINRRTCDKNNFNYVKYILILQLCLFVGMFVLKINMKFYNWKLDDKKIVLYDDKYKFVLENCWFFELFNYLWIVWIYVYTFIHRFFCKDKNIVRVLHLLFLLTCLVCQLYLACWIKNIQLKNNCENLKIQLKLYTNMIYWTMFINIFTFILYYTGKDVCFRWVVKWLRLTN